MAHRRSISNKGLSLTPQEQASLTKLTEPRPEHVSVTVEKGTGEEVSPEMLGFHNQPCFPFFLLIVKTDIESFLSTAKNWVFKFQDDEEEWLEKLRGHIGTLAGLIATMSFAAAMAPPGGVVSVAMGDHLVSAEKTLNETISDWGLDSFNDQKNSSLHGGEAVSGIVFPAEYHRFTNWNTLSMFLSLFILFLMLSGLKMKHPFIVWLTSILMCIDLISIGSVFSAIISLTTPEGVWKTDAGFRYVVMWIWFNSLYVFIGIFTLRFVFWLGNVVSKRTLRRDAAVQTDSSVEKPVEKSV